MLGLTGALRLLAPEGEFNRTFTPLATDSVTNQAALLWLRNIRRIVDQVGVEQI